jgi:hypothetical protein
MMHNLSSMRAHESDTRAMREKKLRSMDVDDDAGGNGSNLYSFYDRKM